MDKSEIVYRRFYHSGLIQKFDRAERAAKQLFGIQSQYLNHGLFNLYNRVKDIEASSRTLLADRELVLAWGQRNTLHIYDRETWYRINQFLHQETWVPKYFVKNGLDLEHEIHEFLRILDSKEILVRDLKEHYQDSWSPIFDWSALFLELSRQGRLYVSLAADGQRKIHYEERQPDLSLDRQKAAYQFFRQYGPATFDDLVHFFGTNKNFWGHDWISSELSQFEFDQHTFYYVDEDDLDKAAFPDVLLLGKFDPLLVAYSKKDILVSEKYLSQVWGRAGQISALVFVRGQFAGKWNFRMGQNSLSFKIQLLKSFSRKKTQRLVSKQLEDFARWMGKSRTSFVWETFV